MSMTTIQRGLSLRFFSPVLALFICNFMGGCAEPTMIRTRDELAGHLGQKVSVEGIYEIGEKGEYVRSGGIEVGLDVNPDLLGFGRSPLTEGMMVHASGLVERGAMSLGIFIDAQTLAASRSNAEHPLVPGFVLRDAKVHRLIGSATQPAITRTK